jgi:hypothetical protein
MTWTSADGPAKRVPRSPVVAFTFAVVAGICAAFSLLVDAATGISGFYLNGWVIVFYVSGVATFVLFGAAVGLGVAALARRGDPNSLSRRRLGRGIGELVAIVVLVIVAEYDIGGYGVPLLVDLLVLTFLGGLIQWNVEIWRQLQTPE